MADIARVTLTGNLTQDPELNESGKMLRFGLGSNRRVKAGDEWTNEASFFTVKVLGGRATPLGALLEKGMKVAIEGRLVQERWEKDGDKRSTVVVIADEVVLMSQKSEPEW